MKRRAILKATPVAVLPALLSGMTIKAFGASPLISALTANDSDTDHVFGVDSNDWRERWFEYRYPFRSIQCLVGFAK